MSAKPTHSEILAQLSITELNEMQTASIAANIKNNDVVLLSPTGSGKTLGFLLPVFDTLKTDKTHIQALIVVPSRELALQIESVWKKMKTGFKITCVYGGHEISAEANNLIEAPTVLIGTPGRLVDHVHRETIKLDKVSTLVLDEFDKSLQMGFEEEMGMIYEKLPKVKKRLLTSATKSRSLPGFIDLSKAETLNYIDAPTSNASLQLVEATPRDKYEVLLRLLGHIGQESAIVFCNQRDEVDEVCAYLYGLGVVVTNFHGGIEQNYRESSLIRFRNGSTLILVTTDLGARGLDIPEIRHVIHFNLPKREEEFIHRNGRTARMGAGGAVYVLDTRATLPAYIDPIIRYMLLDPKKKKDPAMPVWETLFISAGKKDKVNKVDVVGFLSKKGGLGREELGLVEIKDEYSYAAVLRDKVSEVLKLTKDEKLKGRKVKIEAAREVPRGI